MTVLYESKTCTTLDRMFHAWLGRLSFSISPAAVMLAYLDWVVHLAQSPGKQMELMQKAIRKTLRCAMYSSHAAFDGSTTPCITPLPQDRRFDGEPWQHWPFNASYQWFLHVQQWWHNATREVHGVSRQHEEVVEFMARQVQDMFSPSNFPLTNPEILKATVQQGGGNLVRGWFNWLEDLERVIGGKRPVGTEDFQVGRDVAMTQGKVIYRNALIELIQYAPATQEVYREPVLIIPAWIMKYYILDLSPHNSLVKYLVDQGHTVFMVSWKNPGLEDRDLGMEDYRKLGVMAALDAVLAIVPEAKIHALGYCLGGTLLSIAAAVMARDGDSRLQSLTLLAAQTDFTEVGELGLFINPSQVAYLEDIMWEQGYLDTSQMAGAFSLLRSNDLIWSAIVHDYLLGERRPMIDLMAWNADATRLPYRMHTEYLERLYLNNELAQRRYRIDGRSIGLGDLRAPIFAVGTLKDHVAPWRSVFKIHRLARNSEVTFVLTSGGHNAGIVSPPGHPHRSFQVATRKIGSGYVDPDTWLADTSKQEGSWWPAWEAWLVERSGDKLAAPKLGAKAKHYAPLGEAPGSYVLMQ